MGVEEIMNPDGWYSYTFLLEERCKKLIDNGMVFESNFLHGKYRDIGYSQDYVDAVYALLILSDDEVSEQAYRALKRSNEQTGATSRKAYPWIMQENHSFKGKHHGSVHGN